MDNFEKILNERKKELQEGLASISETAKPVELNQAIGRLSRMDAIQQQQMALNTKKQLEINLAMVEKALDRLKNGEYGICLSCGEEIAKARLLVKPEAPFCMNCQK